MSRQARNERARVSGSSDTGDGLLLDALGIARADVIGHDVGGAVMQPLGRKSPARLAELFFSNFVYPGIGSRMGTPDRLSVIWYRLRCFGSTVIAEAMDMDAGGGETRGK